MKTAIIISIIVTVTLGLAVWGLIVLMAQAFGGS